MRGNYFRLFGYEMGWGNAGLRMVCLIQFLNLKYFQKIPSFSVTNKFMDCLFSENPEYYIQIPDSLPVAPGTLLDILNSGSVIPGEPSATCEAAVSSQFICINRGYYRHETLLLYCECTGMGTAGN